VLTGALGAGAVLASVVLPTLRQHISPRVLLTGGLLIYAAMLGMVGQGQAFVPRLLWIVCGGMAWSAIVTTLNSVALSEFPRALRARTLSVYIFMIAVGQTAGGALWALLAARFGVVAALASAGVLMLACASAILLSTNLLEDQ
jgi:predicted MFS family arabinose efflux permease